MAENRWHRCDMKKLRHCHPMYIFQVIFKAVSVFWSRGRGRSLAILITLAIGFYYHTSCDLLLDNRSTSANDLFRVTGDEPVSAYQQEIKHPKRFTTISYISLVSDIAIFVLKRDVKLQLTHTYPYFLYYKPVFLSSIH